MGKLSNVNHSNQQKILTLLLVAICVGNGFPAFIMGR